MVNKKLAPVLLIQCLAVPIPIFYFQHIFYRFLIFVQGGARKEFPLKETEKGGGGEFSILLHQYCLERGDNEVLQ